MRASDSPAPFPIPFASTAGPDFARPIPAVSQITIEDGAASLNDGFPPLNFLPVANGGIPFKGKDLNGILRQITSCLRWTQAGGLSGFSSAFASSIGGYPKGGLLKRSDGNGLWVSTTDNNMSDPDAGGGGWLAQRFTSSAQGYSVFANFTDAEIADALSGAPTINTTAKVQAAIDYAVVNRSTLILQGTLLTAPLTVTADDVRWLGIDRARLLLAPGVYPNGSHHVSVIGDRAVISDIGLDGNQWNMAAAAGGTAQQGAGGLLVSGKSPTLTRVSVRHSVNVGLSLYSNNGSDAIGVARGLFHGCSFDDNAGLGAELVQSAFHSFVGCTFDRNGYGFHKTRANPADSSHDFAAFGLAVRFQSHHIELVACHARNNGRDGFNVNQGTYAVKFAQCTASGNDDGGFTIAADQTGSGLAGEGESCFDIEYVDCEGCNNFSAGLIAYQAAHRVTVSGGRYYNNHRIAGNSPAQTSFFNGIYFAAGSTGIEVDAKAYDERQFRSITAVSGTSPLVLTVPGWVPGSMLYYPKVAIYSGDYQSFLGYGKIFAEGIGTVTLQPTAADALVPSAVQPGMYVTQAVQHNGCMVDNGCTGSLAIDGHGHHRNALPYSGRRIVAAYYDNGTNIALPKERRSSVELLMNPGFEAGISQGWVFSNPAGASATSHVGAVRRSVASLAMVGGTTAENFADAVIVSGAAQRMSGEFVSFGAWSYANSRGDAAVRIFTQGGAKSSSVVHPGGGWRFLRVCLQVNPTELGAGLRLAVAPGKTAYFDECAAYTIDIDTDNRDFALDTRSLPY